MDSELDQDELIRLLQAEQVWFEASHSCLGSSARPLSLLSAHALRLMGVTWLESVPGDLEKEARELAVYVWLHTAPLAEVKASLWTGEWVETWIHAPDVPDIVRAGLRAERERLTSMLAAVTTAERPKPRKGKDDTPRDVLPPSLLTFRLMVVRAEAGLTLDQAGWHLPLVQAMQIYHAARWREGVWTVRAGTRQITPADVTDLAPDWLQESGPH
jgi:hypothetical protein